MSKQHKLLCIIALFTLIGVFKYDQYIDKKLSYNIQNIKP